MEITLAARDRESLIWSLIAPVAMAAIMGSVFRESPPGPTHFALDAGDNPAFVAELVTGMMEKKGLVATDNERVSLVQLPDNVIKRLADGDPVDVVVDKRRTTRQRAETVAAKAREVMFTLAFRARESWLDDPPSPESVATMIAAEGPLRLESKMLGKRPRPVGGKVHQLPAMLVMFMMFQLTTFFMVTWVEDIKTGKIKRIVMSPTRMRDLLAAQLVSRLAWGFLQVVVILGAGSIVLRVDLDLPWAKFVPMLLAYMTTAIAVGLLVGTFFRTTEKANAVGVALALLLAALGGCWWPLEVVSDTMRNVAMVLPTGLMMDAMGEFIALGKDAEFPMYNFLALAGMTFVLIPIAVRRMRAQIVS